MRFATPFPAQNVYCQPQGQPRRPLSGEHLFGSLTEQLLRRAGLTPGMRVLNIGCGAGDVAVLAATLVGPTGYVLGVDRNPNAVATAKRRAASAGLGHVDVVAANINTFTPPAPVDALIGRFALAALDDPAATIRRLCQLVRPGGVVTFQEIRLAPVDQPRALSFAAAFRHWDHNSSRWADLAIDTGSQLFTLFLRAGLPAPHMLLGAWADGALDAPVDGAALPPALVGAWTRTQVG